MKKIFLILSISIACLCGHVLAQTVTQLDNDHYFVQFTDGTNEVISESQTNANVGSCYKLWQRYGPVLNEINQGNVVTQSEFTSAIQSMQAQSTITSIGTISNSTSTSMLAQ